MDGLAGALATAGLALLAKIAFDQWEKVRDRQGIAASLAGEITAYVTLIRPEKSIAAYRAMKTLDPEMLAARLQAMPTPPSGHPVFDKVAEKVGRLPAREAADISAIYNIITGMRLHIARLSTAEFAKADRVYQAAIFEQIASAIENYIGPAGNLVHRLEWISRQGFWSTSRGMGPPDDFPSCLPRVALFDRTKQALQTLPDPKTGQPSAKLVEPDK